MIRQTIVGLVLIVFAGVATAESGGLFTGRVVKPGVAPDMSVEAMYIKYGDGSQMGGRISKVLNDKMIGYADYSKIDSDLEIGSSSPLDFSGNSIGAGVFYLMPDKLEGRLPSMLDDYDVAAQLSYHKISLGNDETLISGGGSAIDIDSETTVIAVSLVISSLEPIQDNGLHWYGSVGVERISNKLAMSLAGVPDLTDSSTEFAAALGVVLPTEFGEVYGGLEYSDGAIYGVGARYHF
ncbi:MAG: hypothetical protein V3U76_03045 [Granulosicoccus sp.]